MKCLTISSLPCTAARVVCALCRAFISIYETQHRCIHCFPGLTLCASCHRRERSAVVRPHTRPPARNAGNEKRNVADDEPTPEASERLEGRLHPPEVVFGSGGGQLGGGHVGLARFGLDPDFAAPVRRKKIEKLVTPAEWRVIRVMCGGSAMDRH
jgi:hypothetical protein